MTLPSSPASRQRRFGPDPIPGVIPAGGVNILGGLPSAGKSRMLAWWCHAWLTGGSKIFNVAVPRLNVGILSTDRSFVDSTGLWFDAYGLTDVAHYSLQDEQSFDWKKLRRREERHAVLEASVGRLFERMRAAAAYDEALGNLVICDTISTFIPNTMDYNEVFVSISGIRRLAQNRICTLLGTMHAAKQRMGPKERYCRLIDRIAGSVAITGTADTMCYIAIPEETEAGRPLFEWHPHHAPRQQFELNVDPNGLFSWDGKEVASLEQINARGADQLLQVFANDAEELQLGSIIKRAELVGMDSLNEKTFRRWINTLVKDGQLKKVARGCYKRIQPS